MSNFAFETLVTDQLYAIARQLGRICQTLEQVMKELDDLKAAVAAEKTVVTSAVTLLNGLKAQLDAAIAAGDPAALKALSDDLGAQTAALAAAVQANTPHIDPLVIISATPLAHAQVGVPYTQEFDATGGVKPYAWSSSDLPVGMALDAVTGIATVTPPAEAAGKTATFDMMVIDKEGSSVTKSFELTVDALAAPAPTPAAPPAETPPPAQ